MPPNTTHCLSYVGALECVPLRVQVGMRADPTFKPQLRPIEAFRVPDGDGGGIAVRDRSGLSDAVLTMSEATLGILALMDGDRTVEQIRDQYLLQHGQSISNDDLQTVLEHLERAHLLEGEVFEALYRARMDEYRRRGARAMLDPNSLGIGDGSGDLFDAMLAEAPSVSFDGPVVGLIAPHLDYPRGRPCYARAYATLRDREAPKRVVILGTNHMGRATSAVATGSNFATPLGTTPTDLSFLERLEDRCGDLRACELDHAREHSVELQVAWLQHLFGATAFEMLAVLCPDPCGPTGTAPYDGTGVDLRDFAQALREVMVEDGADTLLVAGADLSHVGEAFGDDPVLDDGFLGGVRIRDENALRQLVRRDAEAFRCSVADDGNPTRVCSAGCLFTVANALRDATPTLLGYHQAVDQSTQTCVTCAAIAYT